MAGDFRTKVWPLLAVCCEELFFVCSFFFGLSSLSHTTQHRALSIRRATQLHNGQPELPLIEIPERPGTSKTRNSSRQLSIMLVGGVLLVILLQLSNVVNASVWYNDVNASIQDNCDYTKWRICEQQSDCDTYDKFQILTFAGINTKVPNWESEESYYNYKNYKCISPDEEIGQSFSWPSSSSSSSLESSSSESSSSDSSSVPSCPTKRCIPDTLQSAYTCDVDDDCFDGQVCNDNKLCTSCSIREGLESSSDSGEDSSSSSDANAIYYSNGACSQPKTDGIYGSPAFDKHQSGCAGDHCNNICSYDTQCVRITKDTKEIDITATHNQLPGIHTLNDNDRSKLMRPSMCGGIDAGIGGIDGGGMRCARTIIREITSKERTPTGKSISASTTASTTSTNIRDREQNIVELSIKNSQNYITIAKQDYDNDRVLLSNDSGYGNNNDNVIGYNVNENGQDAIITDTSENIRTVGTGVLANSNGLVWRGGDRRGLIRCDVKYSKDLLINNEDDDADSDSPSQVVSTLLTRVCVRFEKGEIDTGSTEGEEDEWTWKNDDDNGSTTIQFVQDDDTYCFPWGTTSSTTGSYYFAAKCSISGPNVIGYDRIPSVKQREEMKQRLLTAFNDGSITIWDVLRVSFHDAAAFTPSPTNTISDGTNESEIETIIRGGPRGCIRYEHVHGNAPNIGLAQTIDTALWNAIGCQPARDDYNSNNHYYQPGFDYDQNSTTNDIDLMRKCISMADAIQFAGAVSIEAANGPSFSHKVSWGRVDAPRMFCTGELQKQMPDSNGGHKEGTMKYGSSPIKSRLETVYNSTKLYFEEQLGLSNEEWVAYLGGGHSLGGVKGLISARNTRFNFDKTPNIFDMLYLDRIDKASKTNLLSLCPQMNKPGSSHFFEPTYDKIHSDFHQNGEYTALIDTDVSLTTNDETMNFVQKFRSNSTLFYDTFQTAYLHVSELGYEETADGGVGLVTVGSSSSNENDNSDIPSDMPSSSPSPKPTITPTSISSSCSDDRSWKYINRKGKKKSCKWVRKKPKKRCRKKIKDVNRKSAKKACPVACGTCPEEIEI